MSRWRGHEVVAARGSHALDFDKLISGAGLLLVAVLLVAGGLLTWAHVFIDDQVHDQLAMQGITMPARADLATLPQATTRSTQYAGQPLDHRPRGQGVRRPATSSCT